VAAAQVEVADPVGEPPRRDPALFELGPSPRPGRRLG
jgi:hypothetical protein